MSPVPRSRAGRLLAGTYLLWVLVVTGWTIWDDQHYTGIGANLGFVVPLFATIPASLLSLGLPTVNGMAYDVGLGEGAAQLVSDLLFGAEVLCWGLVNIALATLLARLAARIAR